MEALPLSSHLEGLLDPRWRPRLNLTSSERDNLFRWDGGTRDHFETYVVELALPEHGVALWLRHEIRMAARARIAPRLRVVAVLYDFAGGQHRSLVRHEPLTALDFSRRRFHVRVGDCELHQAGARGRLGDGALRWDLCWEPRRVSARPLVWEPLYDADWIPSKMLIPNEAVPTWGRVEIDGRTLDVRGGLSQQQHQWGRQSPRRWMACHVDAFAARSDCRLEAFQVQDWVRGRPSPWLTSVRMTYRHRTYFFPRVTRDLERSGQAPTADGWSFSCGRGPLHFRGRIAVARERYLAVRFEDPDGSQRVVSTAAGADAVVEVLRRGGLRFHREVLLRAPHGAWLELAGDEAVPGVAELPEP
jgi:hypothetical protein